ncbi:uncharacterized protein BXIN_2257 [Babesia sp. Xinjiang]|uniref:uncharacterized protein n=1 Tax=Babesia sp. Xinjiang TaxID=462227 RepID=UPI000A21F722|nr:uncharacterized protein BXIN_2257 [Babesia sp. Xinjiang]ORM40639.1 hypothetical protein BXIN_2257 [Babesia sp. Xinjiang]
METVNNDAPSRQHSKYGFKKTITWDEKTISEHDKARGTRTKILEVATPFCYMSDADSLDESSNDYQRMDCDNLAQKVVDRLCEIEKISEKSRQFAELRKQHYSNEYLKRRYQPELDDCSDDERDSDLEEMYDKFVNYKILSDAAGKGA